MTGFRLGTSIALIVRGRPRVDLWPVPVALVVKAARTFSIQPAPQSSAFSNVGVALLSCVLMYIHRIELRKLQLALLFLSSLGKL